MSNICVLGCGTWGSALAQILAFNDHNVTMWHYDNNKLLKINKDRSHPNLPNFTYHSSISFDHDLKSAIKNTDLIVIATPSKSVRSLSRLLGSYITPEQIIVSTPKGLESKTLKRMSEVIREEINTISEKNIIALYGPSHAEEVIKKFPTAIVAASLDIVNAQKVQSIFSS